MDENKTITLCKPSKMHNQVKKKTFPDRNPDEASACSSSIRVAFNDGRVAWIQVTGEGSIAPGDVLALGASSSKVDILMMRAVASGGTNEPCFGHADFGMALVRCIPERTRSLRRSRTSTQHTPRMVHAWSALPVPCFSRLALFI